MTLREYRLENGLQIIAECNDSAYTTALAFFVKTGARDEPPALAGISHFLEHMAFKGSGNKTADDVNRQFDEIGASYNAFTAEEVTAYHAAVLPEYLPRALELLAELLRPALRPGDFEAERQVILEEIYMYEDLPPFGADEKCRALFFGAHPLGNSILGTKETIGAMTVEQMRDYHLKQYAPQNILLAAAGKVDFSFLVEKTAALCESWKPAHGKRTISAPAQSNRFANYHRPAASQEYVVHMTTAPPADSPLRFAADLLTVIVGDDSGSRLFWELVDPGLAEQASLCRCEYSDAAVFVTSLAFSPEKIRQVSEKLATVYQQITRGTITPDELQRAKQKTCARLALAAERPQNRAFAIAGDRLLGKPYQTTEEIIQQIQAVTLEQVREVAHSWPLTRGTIVAIGPLEQVEPPPGFVLD